MEAEAINLEESSKKARQGILSRLNLDVRDPRLTDGIES